MACLKLVTTEKTRFDKPNRVAGTRSAHSLFRDAAVVFFWIIADILRKNTDFGVLPGSNGSIQFFD